MPSKKRPRIVTWLAVGVLILAALQFARLALGLGLPALPLSIPRWYIPLLSAVWGLSAALAAYGLLRGHSWAYTLTCWGSVALAAWYWLDRLWLVRSDYARRTWPIGLVFTLIALGAVFWALSRPVTRKFFREDS